MPNASELHAPPAAHAFLRKAAERGRVSEQLVSLVAPGSYVADQYRALRQNLERLRKDAGLKVLAVTSPAPGDGKSVTTINVAGALAQSPSARVVVIDADLRRPMVAQYLGLTSSGRGLGEALEDSTCTLADVTVHLDGFNLSVVPAGHPRPSPYELLNSKRLEHLLDEARQRFDFVLIDTPPTVPFPDCRLIGRWTEGLLLVVAANRTPKRLVAEALALFDPAKVVGVVLNGDNRPLSSHYGYYQYYASSPRDRGRLTWRWPWRAR